MRIEPPLPRGPVVPAGHDAEDHVVALTLEGAGHQLVVAQVALRRAARQDEAGVAAAPSGAAHVRDERRDAAPVLEALLAVDPFAEEGARLQEKAPEGAGAQPFG